MKAETKVGILFLVIIILIIGFAYALGSFNPFSQTHNLYVMYNFAGGIEEGSPVRVMGIKVGKVKKISFNPKMKDDSGKEVKLVLKISVSKDAWSTVRKDSQFFINLAGIIGEKFIEITPGSLSESEFKPDDKVRGVDPPRVDQLISQGYGLAGKLLAFFEENEGKVIDTLETINKLVTNLNKTLLLLDKTTNNKETRTLMKNLIQIAGDLAFLTQNIRTEDGQKTLKLLHNLLWRLDELDKKAIKKFFQEEGIKAKLF